MIKPGDTVRVLVGFSWPDEYKVVRYAKLGRVPAAVLATPGTYYRTFALQDLELVEES